MQNVAVIGASDNPEKYAYKAAMMLKLKGHHVFPVHHKIKTIEDMNVYPSIKEVPEPVHTVTLYVSSEVSSRLADEIIAKKPARIIFNPGAENPDLEKKAQDKGIKTLNACTLVMLSTGQFE